MNKSLEDSPFYAPAIFGLMLLGILILFGEFIYSGKLLYGADTVTSELYHRTVFIEYFREHKEILQWDPYIFGGLPYVDSFQGDTFYPFSVLKFFLPLYFQLGFNLVLHIYLAGIFMFLAARQFGLGKTASLFSAASYMFAPCLISLVASGHDGNISVATLFPLVMLLLDRGFKSKPLLNFTLLGLMLGAIILTPHPRLAYFTLWAVALYTLYSLVETFISTRKLKVMIKPAAWVAYALTLALLLSAIQFYPGFLYTSKHSVRTQKESNWRWATSWSIHEDDVVSQLIPEFSGYTSKFNSNGNYWGRNAFKDSTETVGIVSLFLASIGLFFFRRKDAYFFGVLGLFAFTYALGETTPVFKLYYNLIPRVDSLRAPAMIIFIFNFSIAILAGMGVQSIADWKTNGALVSRKKFYYLLACLPLLMLLLALTFSLFGAGFLKFWTTLFFKEALTWQVQLNTTLFDIGILNLGAVKFGAWIGLALAAITAILIYVYLNFKVYTLTLTFLIALPIVDGVRINSKFVNVVEPVDYLRRNDVVDFFATRPGIFRIFNQGTNFPSVYLSIFGFENIDGFHRNKLQSFDELLKGKQSTPWDNPRFLNLVGAKYILLHPSTALDKNYYGPLPLVIERYSKYLKIVRNDNAFDRCFLVNSFAVIKDHDQLINEVLMGQKNLSATVFLEEEPEINITKSEIETDSARIVARTYDSVVIRVNCSANRLLVLVDNYYDSWHAFVDGKQVKINRANGSFRAVAVSAGSREVVFKYKSKKYELGKVISVLTSIYIIIIIGTSFWIYRVKRSKGEYAPV